MATSQLFVGTASGAYTVSVPDGKVSKLPFPDLFVNHLAARDGVLLAAASNFGPIHGQLYGLSPDKHHQDGGLYACMLGEAGKEARRVWDGNARSCGIGKRKTGFAWYVGVEPADVFVSSDQGKSWTGTDSFKKLPSRPGWTWPAEPHDPHVLSIDFANEDDAEDEVVVGVEVGGCIARLPNGQWEERNKDLCVDVHFARPDPFNLSRWFAITGGFYRDPDTPGGLYGSEDKGHSWRQLHKAMPHEPHAYMTGIALNPHTEGEMLLTTGYKAPHIGTHVYLSQDKGASWQDITDKVFAEVSGRDGTTPVPYFVNQGAVLGLENGSVLWSADRTGYSEWQVLCKLPARVNTIALEGHNPSSVMH